MLCWVELSWVWVRVRVRSSEREDERMGGFSCGKTACAWAVGWALPLSFTIVCHFFSIKYLIHLAYIMHLMINFMHSINN